MEYDDDDDDIVDHQLIAIWYIGCSSCCCCVRYYYVKGCVLTIHISKIDVSFVVIMNEYLIIISTAYVI